MVVEYQFCFCIWNRKTVFHKIRASRVGNLLQCTVTLSKCYSTETFCKSERRTNYRMYAKFSAEENTFCRSIPATICALVSAYRNISIKSRTFYNTSCMNWVTKYLWYESLWDICIQTTECWDASLVEGTNYEWLRETERDNLIAPQMIWWRSTFSRLKCKKTTRLLAFSRHSISILNMSGANQILHINVYFSIIFMTDCFKSRTQSPNRDTAQSNKSHVGHTWSYGIHPTCPISNILRLHVTFNIFVYVHSIIYTIEFYTSSNNSFILKHLKDAKGHLSEMAILRCNFVEITFRKASELLESHGMLFVPLERQTAIIVAIV